MTRMRTLLGEIVLPATKQTVVGGTLIKLVLVDNYTVSTQYLKSSSLLALIEFHPVLNGTHQKVENGVVTPVVQLPRKSNILSLSAGKLLALTRGSAAPYTGQGDPIIVPHAPLLAELVRAHNHPKTDNGPSPCSSKASQ